MGNERILVPLDDLGVVRVHGPEACSFLQGQLSNDVTRLAPERSLLAGYHNPLGRTIAIVRLLWLGAEDIAAVLPRELAGPVAARLGKFVLRAKVKIADESSAWQVRGLIGPQARDIYVSQTSEPANGERHLWHRLDIEAGQPQVFAATSEEFVAQMLNLDALQAIALDKGCYTGQEVIARAHYRGRVKRRLQRFLTRGPARLAPGHSGTLPDGRAFKVVDAVSLDDGRCEFLAVVPLVADATEPTAAILPLDADNLPLPYALPE